MCAGGVGCRVGGGWIRRCLWSQHMATHTYMTHRHSHPTSEYPQKSPMHSLSLTHTHTLGYTRPHVCGYAHIRTPNASTNKSHTNARAHTHTNIHPLSHSLTYTYTHTLKHTHTHAQTYPRFGTLKLRVSPPTHSVRISLL